MWSSVGQCSLCIIPRTLLVQHPPLVPDSRGVHKYQENHTDIAHAVPLGRKKGNLEIRFFFFAFTSFNALKNSQAKGCTLDCIAVVADISSAKEIFISDTGHLQKEL